MTGSKPVILYSYFRSSATWRVRAALEYKKIPYELRTVHLLNGGGEQNRPEYKKLNPMAEVPTLVHGDFVLGQSLAILDYLDRVFEGPKIFPIDPEARARTLQICECVNAGIHPVQNLKVLQELEKRFAASQEIKTQWAGYWIERGFVSLEEILRQSSGRFCMGDEVSAADFCLVPQVYNARRYGVNLEPFARICAIESACMSLEIFQKSSPERQPQ